MANSDQIKRAESYTIESGTSVETLMERAGLSVFEEISIRYQKQPVQVLCGPGNNGGDGYVIARLLSEAAWPVEVLEPAEPSKALSRSKWSGPTLNLSCENLKENLIVDALFGIGLKRNVQKPYSEIITALNSKPRPVVSVDIPSGIDSDTGAAQGCAIKSNLTVTFDLKKIGHLILPGKSYCGELTVKPIGIMRDPAEIIQVYANTPELWQHLFPLPDEFTHKYTRGFLSILGGDQMPGAAILASLAARRTGVGMCRIESTTSAIDRYKNHTIGTLTQSISNGLEFANDQRITAALIGPGCGQNDITRQAVLTWLETKKPCVLDADALTLFKNNPQDLFERLHPAVVLTPHEGEFSHLFNLDGCKIEKVQQASNLCGAIVLLKGSDTVIADPTGLTVIQQENSPFLATGGTGDILAGMIASLLAQGMPSIAAAACATYTHSKAASTFGIGLIAEDIPNLIPPVLKTFME